MKRTWVIETEAEPKGGGHSSASLIHLKGQ